MLRNLRRYAQQVHIKEAQVFQKPAIKAEKETLIAPTKLKKFWKHTAVQKTNAGYSILLDGKALKTPSGSVLVLPGDKPALSLLTALEWDMQEKVLKSYSLPLVSTIYFNPQTSIVMRATDSLANQSIRAGVIDGLLKYVHTDSICYQQNYPESFVNLQTKYWKPIIDWITTNYHLKIETTEGILRVKQNEEVLKKFREIIESYDLIKLAAFEKAVLRTKSFMIGLAICERAITVNDATCASRLEVMHQIDRWGEVEGELLCAGVFTFLDSHDLDREDLKRQLGSVVAAIVDY